MKKKINLTLDKLDQEYLKALRERTGKSDSELLKMALGGLYRKLVEEAVDNKPAPQIIYVYPPTLQQSIFSPIIPLTPNPLEQFPYRTITVSGANMGTDPNTGTAVGNGSSPISSTGFKYDTEDVI